MKKVISGALAAAIITSNLPLRVLAEEVNPIVEPTDSKEENTVERTGYIEVDINLDMPIYSNKGITVALKADGKELATVDGSTSTGSFGKGSSYTVESLGLGRNTEVGEDGKIYAYRVTFKNLPAGTGEKYRIALSGNGFSNVESDDIEINNYSKRIIVNNAGKSENRESENESLLPIGDVNNDKIVENADYDAVFAAIGGTTEEYDLNRDGKVNIADLQYVHDNMGRKAGSLAAKNTEWIPTIEKVEAKGTDGTVIPKENIEKIFDGSSDSSLSISAPSSEKISESNAAQLSLDLSGQAEESTGTNTVKMQYLSILGTVKNGSIIINGDTANPITFDENGNIKDNTNTRKSNKNQANLISTRETEKASNEIVIDLGKQIAVSQITINVTGVSDDRNLAEIAKVEFLNNIYKEIPKPEISIPSITSVTTSTSTGNEYMYVKWESKDQNLTGYELKVEEIDEKGNIKGTEKKFRMSENEFKVTNVKPYSRYRLSVQALNGAWEGGYKLANDDEKKGVIDNVVANTIESGKYTLKDIEKDGIVNIMVVPEKEPTYPEGITAEGNYKSIALTWKKHYAAQQFDVYYREQGTEEFVHANEGTKITGTSYKITGGENGLKDKTTYEIYMTATNHHGDSPNSPTVIATTVDMSIPITQKYNLINRPANENSIGKTSNIKDVIYPNITIPEGDEDKEITSGEGDKQTVISNKYAVVDNNYGTYWAINDTDSGIADVKGNNGPRVEFENKYTIDKIAIISKLDGTGMTPEYPEVMLYNGSNDKTGTRYENNLIKLENHTKNGFYSTIKFSKPITVKEGQQIQVNLRSKSGKVSITELKFYEYDTIKEDINKLFIDDLYLVLDKSVDASKLEALETRLNTENNGEKHPDYDDLKKKLDRAKSLLADTNLNDEVTTVDILINADGVNTGYGNDWQALGLAAKAGDTIKVYLSRDLDDNAANRDVYLAYEQNYAESGSAISEPIKLKPGENEIKIDKLISYDRERGGNLYVRMEGKPEVRNTKIRIRVSGAKKIPHLNLNNNLEDVDYLVKNKDKNDDKKVKEVKDKLKVYIETLKEHVETVKNNYPSEKDSSNNIYPYDEKTSILNSTNIEGDRFTLTVPASQIYNSLVKKAGNDINAQVDTLYDSMLAWEQLIQITNAKKGVMEGNFEDNKMDFNSDGVINDTDKSIFNKTYKASRQRVNVKYQKMFGTAFMYASSHHVGVEFGSTADFVNGVPYQFDENGKVTNLGKGYLFGWGISHEIGHKADIGKRTYGETSNNILALITQTFDGVSKSRLELNGVYSKIYKKVTSNSVGASQDVATLLGMFWQLHLAYEPGYTSQMLKNNTDKDLKNDSYYAKMNRLYRNLTTDEEKMDKDQLLILKASEAAGKDLRGFFASWGLVANDTTKVYLQQLIEKGKIMTETRKIQYLNDEAYRKRLQGVSDMAEDTTVKASFANGVKDNTVVESNSITLNINVNKDNDKILGYEIIRNDGNIKGGENEGTKVNYRPVGFVNANADGSATFTDNISPINNRAMTYKVIAYDYNLNATKEYTVGSVKLSHNGLINSEDFVLKSNLITPENTSSEESTVNENTTETNELDKIKDGNKNTAFRGRRMTSDEYKKDTHKQDDIDISADPYIIMDLQGRKSVCGLEYTKSSDSVYSRLSLKRLVNAVRGNTTYNAISNYKIYVSDDAKSWTEVSSGNFDFTKDSVLGGTKDANTAKVIFSKDNNGTTLETYDARYVKLVADGATDSNLDIAEISLIGSTGDNIEIGAVDKNTNNRTNGIGKLEADFVYDEDKHNANSAEGVIPKDSIVITGEYKGNPAFNIPLLIDKNNATINGKVVLMAEVEEKQELGEVYGGKWIYWISKEDFNRISNGVKAELYRYNELGGTDGKTPQGQRLVSDTLYVDVTAKDYNSLPTITLESNNGNNAKNRTKSNEKTVVCINTSDYERKEN